MKPEHRKYILENIDKKSINEISQELGIKIRKIKKILKKEEKKEKVTKKVTPSKKAPIFISIILIIILGFSVYSNSLNGKFIWDDEGLVNDNVYIRSWSNIKSIFTKDIGAGVERKFGFYRPLQILTYVVDYYFWKLDVKGYHLTNILLHILATLGIYWLINIFYKDNLLSLLTSIFFVVHPVHTEAICYISGRADPLAVIFIFLCFIFYIKSLHSQKITTFVLTILAYISAILSREISLILPVLLLLYHYTFREKVKTSYFLSISIIAFIYILLRFTVLRSLLAQLTCPTTLFQRTPGFFVAITNYTRLLLLPFHLHMEYTDKLFNLTDPKAILGILILFSLLTYTFKIRNKNRLIFFSISWFIITLLPQSNLYPINAYMAEHWLYLPSIGFFLVIANLLSHLYKAKNFKTLVIILVISLSAFYSYLTMNQNNYWREPISFYERILKYAPDSTRVYNNLGKVYDNMGKHEEAIPLFKKAIEISPAHARAYNNLGVTYRSLGKYQEAINLFKKAIEINPYYAESYSNIGVVYNDVGNHYEAIASFKKAIEINPNCTEVYNNLGVAYNCLGKRNEAIASFEKAVKINPNNADAHNNLGVVYYDMNEIQEAIALYKKAIEINPNYATAYGNLAAAYYLNKEYTLAIERYDKAIELGYKVDPEFLKLLEPYRK